MKIEKMSSGMSNLIVLVIFWEFVVKGLRAEVPPWKRRSSIQRYLRPPPPFWKQKRCILGHIFVTFVIRVACDGFHYKMLSYHSHYMLYRLQEIEFILSRTTSRICRFCRIERLHRRFPYSCICRMNFFLTTETTDTTIWKPGFMVKLDLFAPKVSCKYI